MATSFAHIDIRLPLTVLAQTINRYMGRFLAQQPDNRGPFTEVQIEQVAPLTLKVEKGRLRSEVPIRANVRLRRQTIGINLPLMDLDRIVLVVRSIMYSDIQLTDDWHIHSQTEATFTWDQKPQAVGMIRLPIVPLIEPMLARELSQVASEIDSFLATEINLREVLMGAWEALQEEISLQGTFPAYLYLQPLPENLTYTQLSLGATYISHRLRLPIHPSLQLSPQLNRSIQPFPPSQLIETLPATTDLSVEAFLAWDTLESMLSDHTFSVEQGAAIKVRQTEIRPHDQGITLYGSFELESDRPRWHGAVGTCALTMRIHWMPAPAPSIKVIHIELDMSKRWHRWMSRLVRKRLANAIGHQLTEWLTAWWYRLHGEGMTALAHLPLTPTIILATEDPHLDATGMKIEPEGLRIAGSLTGTSYLEIKQA